MNGFSSTIRREERERNSKSFKLVTSSVNNKSETRLKKYVEKKYGKIK